MSAMVIVVVLMTGTHQSAKEKSKDLLKSWVTSRPFVVNSLQRVTTNQEKR
jgi:hypothetical protein